jgi:YVTN family beta-propeller protein
MDSSAGVRMNFWLVARLLGVLILGLICVSCGDQYRPVAVPIVAPPPDPQAVHFVLVFSVNGMNDPGAGSRLDVSGDTNIGVAQLGLGPAHATLTPNGARVYAVNTREDSVSSYGPTPGTTATSVTTTSLPPGSNPVFVHTTETGTVYVANFGNNTVAAISTTTNVTLNPLLTVGTNPVALAETPDQKKLYAVNQGDGTVSPISIVDRTVTAAIPTGTAPVWAAARSDSARIYVLNSGSGTVSTIDTTTDTLLSSVPVGAGANYMAYDSKLNRLYITNPTANTVTALNVSLDPPAVLFATPVAAGPVSVTGLPDSTRAYAVSSTKTPPCTSIPLDTQLCISSQVTVINASDGSVRKTIPLEPTVNITAATQSGSNTCGANTSLPLCTTYSYTLTSGPALRPGMEMVVSGMADPGNNGTFILAGVNAGTFTVANGAGVNASGQSATGTVVVEVSTANPTGCDINGLGVPGGVINGVRFRSSVAASPDSTKVFAGKCDSGSTTVIRSSDDTPVLDMPAPLSTVTPPNGGNALPQNPVFVLAGQ